MPLPELPVYLAGHTETEATLHSGTKCLATTSQMNTTHEVSELDCWVKQ